MNSTFSAKDDDEIITVGINFASLLADGETISTAVVAIRSVGANDPSASSMLTGAASISGATVTQKVMTGLPGVNYRVSFTITTSSNHKYVEAADLPVVERE